MSQTSPRSGFILDADVLIDYCNSDTGILKLVSEHLGRICVPTPTLEEVRQLTPARCQELGLTLFEPEAEDLFKAANRYGVLSFQDHLCLILAKKHKWICVTNERLLHRRCEEAGIAVLRGLRLMVLLVEKDVLLAPEALAVAEQIRESNPRFITPEIVERFKKEIGLPPGESY